MKFRLNVLVFLLLGVIIFFTSILILLSILFVTSYYSKTSINSWNDVYISNEFDPLSNSTIHKFVTLKNRLELSESISYYTPSGTFVIITPFFDNTEYDCSATCVCVDNKEEKNYGRRSAATVMKSLYFIASATSLAFAVQFANSYFSDTCKREYSSMCFDFGLDADYMSPDCKASRARERDGDPRAGSTGTYQCFGRCISLEQLDLDIPDTGGVLKNTYEHESYKKIEGEILSKCDSEILKRDIQAKYADEAYFDFKQFHLTPHCMEIGELENLGDPPPEKMFYHVCFAKRDSVRCYRKNKFKIEGTPYPHLNEDNY